jgi:hypothetical protein
VANVGIGTDLPSIATHRFESPKGQPTERRLLLLILGEQALQGVSHLGRPSVPDDWFLSAVELVPQAALRILCMYRVTSSRPSVGRPLFG